MNKYFNNNILLDIRNYAEEKSPNEMCGFIVGNEFLPVENKADDPEYNFKMSGKDFIEASMHGKIRCIIHSHNNCEWVSEADQIEQQKNKIPFGIVFLKNNKYSNTVFFGDELPIQDLLGRPFIHGVYDCYGLVRDYYRKEYRIVMKNHIREMEWWNHKRDKDGNIIEEAQDILLGGSKEEDLFEVSLKEIKQGDIIFFKIRGQYCNHSAIYLGRDLMMHHLFGKLSNREPIGPYRRFITNILRHRGV